MTVQHRPPPGKYRLTVDDFLRLDETGVFGTDRTELLDGDVIIMSAEYRPHARIAGELGYRIRRVLETIGSNLYAMSASVAISDHDMPLPDIVVTREPRGEGPIPLASVALIVEVSSSTLQRDLRDKVTIYSRARVPEYWVVDVSARVIYRMWSPTDHGFSEQQEYALGVEVSAATINHLVVGTHDL